MVLHAPCQERQMPKLAVGGTWRRMWPRKLWQMWFMWGIHNLKLPILWGAFDTPYTPYIHRLQGSLCLTAWHYRKSMYAHIPDIHPHPKL